MKKIMFNDKFDLTQAVLDGRKTMTRREFKIGKVSQLALDLFKRSNDNGISKIMISKKARYQVGEVIAIAQSYSDCLYDCHTECEINGRDAMLEEAAGYYNKMFVKANLMPHHIRITNIRVERLQDISDEDCLR